MHRILHRLGFGGFAKCFINSVLWFFVRILPGLFVSEAFKSGNFSRIVISEIDQKLVDAVRANNGSYYVNIASSMGIESVKIDGIEIYNPFDIKDRAKLLEAISQSTEICTSLPSVDFYDMGENSIASLIKKGLSNSTAPATIIYTAENNNHAAEILEEKVGSFKGVQFLNAIHFLLALLGLSKGYKRMKNLRYDDEIMTIARDAFLNESGVALMKKYAELNDELFTETGFTAYAEDLLERMTNPYLDDPMYMPSQRIKATKGKSLGQIYDPYFNRTFEHFCSHQHAPARSELSGFDCGMHNGNILYLAHPVFSIYRGLGAVAYKEYIINALNLLLAEPIIKVNLPSTGRVTLMKQKGQGRYVLHLLYANTINRGGPMELSGGTVSGKTSSVEVIDELLPLCDVKVLLSVPEKVGSVICVPDGDELEFSQKAGCVEFVLPRLQCHQMIEIQYA